MKKTYMIPTLKVVEIKPAQFIAASRVDMYSKDAQTEALGREARFFDDEDWDDWEE